VAPHKNLPAISHTDLYGPRNSCLFVYCDTRFLTECIQEELNKSRKTICSTAKNFARFVQLTTIINTIFKNKVEDFFLLLAGATVTNDKKFL
jgi:hypothetical protein